MSKIKIYGKADPEVGIQETYSINDLFGSSGAQQFGENKFQTLSDNQVKWSIWVFDGNSWVKRTENNKTGATVYYTFNQKSLTRKGIRILVDANGEKAVLDITTKKATQSKILHVELLDSNYNKPTRPFAYNDYIIARVYCSDMELQQVTVTLWEDDAAATKENSDNFKFDTQKGDVINGKADVKFFLKHDFAWLANAKPDAAALDEGIFHEYYVTAEIYEKVSKRKISSNVNVINSDYKEDPYAQKKAPEKAKQTPAEAKGPSQKEQKGIAESDRKAYDYAEQKVAINPIMGYNPVREFVNSMLMVNVGDAIWNTNGNKNRICEAEAKVRAFLRMLRIKEGTVGDNCYERIVGGGLFIQDYRKDWSTHPRISVYIRRINDYSTAAGAYQFLESTYDEILKNYGKRYKISDFSPENQDKMCLVLMKHYYRKDRPASFYSKTNKEKEWRKRFINQQGDIIQFIIDGNIKRAALLSSLCWASLPDSPYGQQSASYTFSDLKMIYDGYLIEELIAPSKELYLKKGFLKEFGYNCCEDLIANNVEGKGWNIDVHLWSDRKEMGYGILLLKDDEKNEIWRTVVRAQGFTSKIGKERTQTYADTPNGVYKFEKWRNDGSTEIYGPNFRLDMTYESGEAKSVGREEIQIHGGRQVGDINPYLWNTGGCLRVFDDAIKKLKNKIEELELKSSAKENHFINVTDSLKYDTESKKYFIPDDYEKLMKNKLNNDIINKGIINKKYFRNETNYYTDNLID